MDDHFEHGTLIPLEPTAHRRRPVILTVVVVLILGVLAAIYWRQLIALPSFFSSDLSRETLQEAPPLTPEEKAKLLQSDSDVQAPVVAPLPPEAKAALLEGDTTDTSAGSKGSAPAQELSAEEKAKLLGGQ